MAETGILSASSNEKFALLKQQADELFGKSPFQDDLLDLQKKRESEALALVPNGDSSTPRTQQSLGGDYISGPNPGFKELTNSQQRLTNLTDAFDNIDAASKDPTAFAKPFSYNAGKYNVDFDRYYAHPKFKKFGWSPFRDNEAFYNQNSSWWDDFNRMRGKYLALAGQGLGWGDFNTDADTESARNFEKNMAIAHSSKEGFGASFTNFLGNSAWTVGIIGQMAAEELALVGITAGATALAPVTGGASLGGAAASGTAAITRGAMGIRKLVQGFDMVKNLGKGVRAAYNDVNSADKARTIWNTARTVGGNAVDFLNPLGRTTRFISDISKGAKGATTLNNMALLTRGVGSFYRDIREINLVLNESELEGGSVQNQVVDELISDYYKINGKAPEGEAADRIFENAKEAGAKATLLNIPTIYLSNKIVLGTALRGFKPSSLVRAEMGHGLSGSLVFNKSWKKLGQDPWSVLKGSAKYFNSNYWKQAPSKLISGSLRYGKANFTEGAQELMQEIVSSGAREYYTKIYQDPAIAGNRQFMASFQKGVQDQITGQGLEVFLSGFFMGGLVQGPQDLLFNRVSSTWTKYTDPKEFARIKADRQEYTNRVVNTLNDITKNTGKYASALEENMITQQNLVKVMSEAANNNDRKQYEDGRDESMFSHVYQLLRAGHYDYFVDQLESLKDLNPEELGEAFSTKDPNGDEYNGAISNRLSSVVNRAKQIKNLYDKVNSRFQNPYDPSIYSREKEPEQYALTVDAQNAYEQMKMNIVFGDYAFIRATERMATILDDVGGRDKPLSKAPTSDITVLFDPITRASEIKTLGDEIKAYSDGTPEQKKKARIAEKKRESLIKLSEEISAYETLVDSQRKAPSLTKKESKEIRVDESGSEVISRLREAYYGYIKQLGKDNNEIVIDSNINKSFNGLLDYIELDGDAKAFGKYINFISDPQNAFEHAKRMQNINQELRKKYIEYMDKALREYMRRSDNNDLFNALLKVGVFVHPDDMEKLEVDHILPTSFINVAPPHDQIPITSDKYLNDILPVLKNYSILTDSAPPVEPIVDPTTGAVVEPEAITQEPGASVPTQVYTGPGKIVYATAGTGKSTLVRSNPSKYVDADEVLYKYMQDNDIPVSSVQNAGRDLIKYSGYQDLVPEIQDTLRRIADSGKIVLTGNWFGRQIADEAYLIKDPVRIAKIFEERGESSESAMRQAKSLVATDTRSFEEGKYEIVPEGTFIGDVLEKIKPTVEQQKSSIVKRIDKFTTEDEFTEFNKELIKNLRDDPNYLEKRGITSVSELEQMLQKRREEITKSITFDTLQKGMPIMIRNADRSKLVPGEVTKISKKNKEVSIKRYGDNYDVVVSEKELPDMISSIITLGASAIPDISTEEKKIADQNVETLTTVKEDPGSRKTIIDNIEKADAKEINDEFDNSIGCK